MTHKISLFFTICLVTFNVSSQNESVRDITKVENLQKLIATAQHNPKSFRKSVFEMKVYSRNYIERQPGNNPAGVLNADKTKIVEDANRHVYKLKLTTLLSDNEARDIQNLETHF